MCIVCAGGDAATSSDPARAPGDKPVFTLEQIIANLDRDNRGWEAGEVTFAFLDALTSARDPDEPEQLGFEVFTAAQEAAVRTVAALLADVADLTFTEAEDNDSSFDRVTFANSTTQSDFSWGYASSTYFNNPDPAVRDNLASSEVWVNSKGGIGSYALGTYNFTALMHEFMHALGVPHPGRYNANGQPITWGANAEYTQDTRQYSVMSYFNAGADGSSTNHASIYGSAPLLHDIAILQHIYGANMTTRTGDTVYGFNSTAGRDAFNFSVNPKPVAAIWDAGGTDTIDLSGYSSNSIIDLREGGFSSFNGLTNNLAVAFGAVVENAVGGSGGDTLYGNAAANRLDGGAGSDRMEGFGGDDTYLINTAGDRIVDTAGRDTLISTVNVNAQIMGAQVEVIRLSGAAVTAVGNGLNNEMHGTAVKNVLNGYKGADTMIGYGGNDSYTVDNAGDHAIEVAGGGYDTVTAVFTHTLDAEVEKLILAGTAGIGGTGNAGQNTIVGNAGANRIAGAGGIDFLTGGAGVDTFAYAAVAESSFTAYDRILDLNDAQDIIDLSAIDAIAGTGTNDDFRLVDAFTRSAGQIVLTYNAAADFTLLVGDVDGDGRGDFRILMNGDHSDFTRILGSDAFGPP